MRAMGDVVIGDDQARRAVALAEELLREARAQQTADERAQARKPLRQRPGR
jgi:hypothetical protein